MPVTNRPLERTVRRLRRRMRNVEAVRRLLRCLLAASIVLLAALLVQRLSGFDYDVWFVGQVAGIAALCVGLVWALFRKPSMHEAAVTADERLNLRERISSALYAINSEEAMGAALIEDAERRAASIRVGDVAPYPFYKELRLLLLVLAATGLCSLLPPMLLFARPNEFIEEGKPIAAEQAKKGAAKLKALQEKLDLRSKLKDPLKLEAINKELEALQKKFEQRKVNQSQAIAKLSKLSDKVKLKQEELAKKMKGLDNLRARENSKFTKDLEKALEKGNLDAAEKKMAELKDKMKSGKMSEQDKKKMAEELEKLAAELKESNPKMAEAMKKAAENMKKGLMNKAVEGMEEAMAAMSEMKEMMDQMAMLDEMSDELAQCQSGMCSGSKPGDSSGEGESDGEWGMTDQESGDWTKTDNRGKGTGMGGGGQGSGGIAKVNPNAVAFKKEKTNIVTQLGEILASIKVKGEQVRGDSLVKYQDALTIYDQIKEDTLEREKIPLELRNHVRDYMDSIRIDVDASGGKADEASGDATHLELAPSE